MKILLVEDEPTVVSFIKRGLEEQGYQIEVAYDGQFGKRFAMENYYDLIILDIILPYINGLELCREIRKENTKVPILMLTALGDTKDKVTGLDEGADDYLVKPFDFDELLARIRALLRRNLNVVSAKTFTIGDLKVDVESREVERAGKKISLTAKEFSLLEAFLKNKGKVLKRSDLMEMVWDLTFDTGTNLVEVYVNYLRNKIDKGFNKKLIHTVVGIGYVLREDE